MAFVLLRLHLVIEVCSRLRHGYAANDLAEDDEEDARSNEIRLVDAGVPYRKEVRHYYRLGESKGMSLSIPAAVRKEERGDESPGGVIFGRDPEL